MTALGLAFLLRPGPCSYHRSRPDPSRRRYALSLVRYPAHRHYYTPRVSKVCKVKEFWFTLALRFDIHHDDTKFLWPQPPQTNPRFATAPDINKKQ
ncbi:hypothetical protein AVEN_150437-1 [Araneus ventricosus]|uniref:Uncharacterized protein n=1 Tax=Araneus ventricosus TaxID=182803 RepID=A0A4Y2PFD1_ARAVE|nr:hypothetical protein AVEN_150437-1 [Araneus ventricosus]